MGKIAYTSIPPCPDTSRSLQGIASLAAPIAPATHPGACAPGPRGTELRRRFWEQPPLRSTLGVSLPCVVQGPWHKGPRLPRPGKPVLLVSLYFPGGLATDVTPEPRPPRPTSTAPCAPAPTSTSRERLGLRGLLPARDLYIAPREWPLENALFDSDYPCGVPKGPPKFSRSEHHNPLSWCVGGAAVTAQLEARL